MLKNGFDWIGKFMPQTEKRSWAPWLIGLAVATLVVWLVSALQSVLTPFVVAGILAYILNPLVEKLRHRGVSRPVAAMLVMLFALALLALLRLAVTPQPKVWIEAPNWPLGFVSPKQLPGP